MLGVPALEAELWGDSLPLSTEALLYFNIWEDFFESPPVSD